MRFDRDNLPPEGDFRRYRKTALTRMAGPYDPPVEVVTREGEVLRGDGPTYLALDANGDPYPVAADIVDATYEEASE